jgi:prepilin-type N-terminal cleavage/methylation domain-containing protein
MTGIIEMSHFARNEKTRLPRFTRNDTTRTNRAKLKNKINMKNTKPLDDSQNGFSLIECLISLSLFLIIVLSCLELFTRTRNIFFKLKEKEEEREAVLAALDKMRTDLHQGGAGLSYPIQLGILEGISEDSGSLIILSREKDLSLCNNLVEGQTRIQLESTSGLKKGREICIFDFLKGEVLSISSVDEGSIVLSSPLNFSYFKEKASLILFKKISLYLDERNPTLRRKVNSSPAQPLLEETSSFDFDWDKAANLVQLRLQLKTKKEKFYEISVFPKNAALAVTH